MSFYPFVPEEPFCNPGKSKFVSCGKLHFSCLAIRTPVIDCDTAPDEVFEMYVLPWVRPGDVVFCSEKMIACAQGRAIPLDTIHPGFTARILSRYVTRSPYGIGLAMPETVQCALDECGYVRILIAAVIGAIGKWLGQKGWFYRVAGPKAAAIDGPCSYTLPPYNRYVIPGPADPAGTVRRLSETLGGNLVLRLDANDLGCRRLAASTRTDCRFWETLLSPNPLGQSRQCTPVGILRPINPDTRSSAEPGIL